MPSYVFNDTLQEYSVGNGIPTGFVDIGIVFTSQFNQTPSPGQAGNTGIVYELNGIIGFPTQSLAAGYTTTTTTVNFSTLSGSGIGTIALACVNPNSPYTTSIPLQITWEADATVSVAVFGATKINSLIPVLEVGTWIYCQLVVTVGEINIGGTNYLTFDFLFAANGQEIINSVGSITSGIIVDPDIGVGINQWQFGLGGAAYYGELVATSDIQAIPFYPNPGSPLHGRSAAIVTEVIKSNQFRQGRICQMPVELIKMPNSRNVRVSQIVVEIIRQNKGTTNPNEFRVIET